MNTIISVLLLVMGGSLIGFFYPKTKRNIKEMELTQTTKISELKELLQDGDNKYVELKGRVSSERLIEAPYSKKQVAYYEYEIERVYEERDNNGGSSRKEERIEFKRSEQEVGILDDSSEESVLLEIYRKCKLDIPTTYNKFEPKGFNLILGNMSFGNDGRTIGYEIKEKSIEANKEIYAIGEVYKSGGKIFMRKPDEGKRPFIVSTKSEEQLIKSSKRTSIIQLVIGILSLIGGIIVFVI